MKRALILLSILGLAFSPVMISQAQAAPVKHVARHNKKHLKKRTAKHHVRRHHSKTVA
jgi:hypothetical protein